MHVFCNLRILANLLALFSFQHQPHVSLTSRESQGLLQSTSLDSPWWLFIPVYNYNFASGLLNRLPSFSMVRKQTEIGLQVLTVGPLFGLPLFRNSDYRIPFFWRKGGYRILKILFNKVFFSCHILLPILENLCNLPWSSKVSKNWIPLGWINNCPFHKGLPATVIKSLDIEVQTLSVCPLFTHPLCCTAIMRITIMVSMVICTGKENRMTATIGYLCVVELVLG